MNLIRKDPLPPFIFLPGAGGVNANVAGFVKRSKGQLPLVLVNYPDWSWQLEHPDFETVLSEVTQSIAEAAPQGPLGIAGYSLGALIAAVAALRLTDRGREVRWIAAIDPVLPGASGLAPRLGFRVVHDTRAAVEAGWRSTVQYAWKLLNRVLGRLLVPRLPRLGRQSRQLLRLFARPGSQLADEFGARLMIKSVCRWDLSFARMPRDTRCVVFHTAESSPDLAFWRTYFAAVTLIETDGNHHSLFKGNLAELLLESWTLACTGVPFSDCEIGLADNVASPTTR
jgi:thioesterase domain-containing protein